MWRVGREKDRREVTRWTVSTTANRRSNLNTINYFHFLEVGTQVLGHIKRHRFGIIESEYIINKICEFCLLLSHDKVKC